MLRSRGNYWSLSPFAKWIQRQVGVEKPIALEWYEWRKWDANFKKEHPYVCWFTEEFLDGVQNVIWYIPDVWNNIRYYIQNRFFDRLHLLPTRLTPGEYHDLDSRILHGLFESLVDFIEIEKAWMCVVFDQKAAEKFPAVKRNWPWWLRFKHFRCPEAGLAHLQWEMSLAEPNIDEYGTDLSCPQQAVSAKEQYELYNWWKNVRPARVDPHDMPELGTYSGGMFRDRERTDEEKAADRTRFDKINTIEEQYNKEDEEMLIRLVRIRRDLWT